jgi:hypothetical protein
MDFSAFRTILFETFKKDGTAVNTPVWFVQEGDTLYVSTSPDAWKAKRLRNNPAARVAGADAAERPATVWVNVTGRFIDGDEAKRYVALLAERYMGYFRDPDVTRVIIALDQV